MGHSLGGGVSLSLASKLCRNQNVDFLQNFTSKKTQNSAEEFEMEVVANSSSSDDNQLSLITEYKKCPPAGVVIISSFTSVVGVLSNTLSDYVSCDMFQNIKKVKSIDVPIFVVHATNDEIIPKDHALTLFNNLKEKSKYKVLYIDDCDHNSILETSVLFDELAKFITMVKNNV
ncbi:hypothetical protein EIN_254970 [Entamoeba invadens IP1]|uniref:Peptidase S9 prolyl oligopeptidase catalytic domain-containing protein n=1 Tax=Entamoeba invadens IP1 TaxID=370355 RepID=A0A0A1UF52_ENTIV|nr:hypothetical protein EIN_254970 [Entamoeba invadens IP1]ELP95113.1 hypothetical protein EIN_254970 [Entamoeba invadens IP1]|eukprot:XP_004261884.1 hypothetical protein EIN_254970 [Entamoeba invadens IP1]